MSAADTEAPAPSGGGHGKAGGKALHSGRLAGMAFMQRAAQRKQLQQRKEQAEEAEDAEHWVLPQTASAAAAGCVVVVEGDPPPASPLGRLSFKGFNPATDKLREERGEAAQARLQRKQDGAETGVTVSDAEMAAQLGPRAQAQKPGYSGAAAASPSSSSPNGMSPDGAEGESGGKKRKKRRREEAAAEGTAGASVDGQPDSDVTAAGFRAPPSLAAGNPFAALMREPKTARKKG